ncbi:MAG: HDOD domain-containing protein [Deltaproteobacteria bacterium]|nr:HDOD domain-containing protein [Deltaproteobacteria bacterium]
MLDRTDQLRRAFQQDPNLPTFPDHIRHILELLAQDDTALSDIAREVEQDPVLTLRVLRLANSAAYGASRHVNSLDRALAVVGMGQIKAIVAGFASVDGCERFLGDCPFDWKEFWSHCTGTAFIARSLAERLELKFRGAEFLGGLLHDIGYLALAKADPTAFAGAVRKATQEHGFLARNLEVGFGLGTEAAGALLAEVSQLAPETQEVILRLHQPAQATEPTRPLVALVSLANELAHLAGLTFFRGTAEVEVVIPELPAWGLLCAARPQMACWDLERLVFDLEHEHAASQEFVHISHAH